MKKGLFVSVLMLSFMFLLAACGTSQETTSGEGSEAGETEEKKTLRVVTDAAYAPFEYQDKGEIIGFDVDFIEAVAEEAGYEIEIEHVGWDPLFVEIKDEIADFGISAITINDDRKQTYDFSVPYFLSTNKILVPEGSDIASAADLEGKVVAVQAGTTGQEAVEGIMGKNNKNMKQFENNNLAIMELTSGGADAVVADNTVVEEYVKNNPDQKLTVVEDADSFASEYYGLMFPKGSELKAEFDEAINKVLDSGKYAEIYNEWFGSDPDIENLKAQQ
ncbi:MULTISPECIES: basic amino acid ABC transporter substrate-binding protein [Metabacillus]|uniref:Basic amino acid ABC transporter substrate-binding protein n=1 Tax=Metabacillus endolithicus TaxID=1535204 RepID=A0ABW5C6G8_9BACI|nr:basic amino acid ABC transporter substrate-binding protein [Metabacillus endolithicus]UPG62039.1 basic amino acid ABC transporter substrate-binding protein [Metabacillus endolithicus]